MPSHLVDSNFCILEEFNDTNTNGPILQAVICRECFEFAYMIPSSTFDSCWNAVLIADPLLVKALNVEKVALEKPQSRSDDTSIRLPVTAPTSAPSVSPTSQCAPSPAPPTTSLQPATRDQPLATELTPLLGLRSSSQPLDILVDLVLYGPSSSPKKAPPQWEWYHAWDLSSNCKEIFIRQREGDLAFLDGIRAIAYMWVLGDHIYQAFTAELTGFVEWWAALGDGNNGYQLLSNSNHGDQGVTSFFVLSGFLIPFIFSRMVSAAKKNSALDGSSVPAFAYHGFEFVFRRYMRIAPSLYAGTLIAFLYGYFMKDVSSSANSTFYTPCVEYWWVNIIFINNLSGLTGLGDCYDSVWTISVEFQLYILTIPVVYFYCWEAEYGWYAALTWTVITSIVRVIVTAYCDASGQPYGALVYLPSWTRAPEYGVGMLAFMVYDHYYSSRDKREAILPFGQLSTTQVLARLAFHTVTFGFLGTGLWYISTTDAWWSASYNQYQSFSYSLWGMALFGVAQISIENVFWPIKWVLSWYVWYPIAQLAYTGGELMHLLLSSDRIFAMALFEV